MLKCLRKCPLLSYSQISRSRFTTSLLSHLLSAFMSIRLAEAAPVVQNAHLDWFIALCALFCVVLLYITSYCSSCCSCFWICTYLPTNSISSLTASLKHRLFVSVWTFCESSLCFSPGLLISRRLISNDKDEQAAWESLLLYCRYHDTAYSITSKKTYINGYAIS